MSNRRDFLKLILSSAAVLTAQRALPGTEWIRADELGWRMGLLEIRDGRYREMNHFGYARQPIDWLEDGEQRLARALFGIGQGNGEVMGAVIYRDGREVARVQEYWGTKTSSHTWEVTVPVVRPA